MRVLLPLMLLAGCQKGPPTTPDGTFRLFTEQLRKQDSKAAFQLLSTKSRTRLETASKALAAASEGAVKDEPALLAFRTPHLPTPLVSIKVASQSDATATLEVHTCQKPLDATGACPPDAVVQESVVMVKEAQRWAVELPDVTP